MKYVKKERWTECKECRIRENKKKNATFNKRNTEYVMIGC
jgi:hypothetical protein